MTKDRIEEMIRMMRFQENGMPGIPHEPVPEETSESITSFLQQVECCREEIRSMQDQISILRKFHNQIQRCTNEAMRKDLEERVEEKKAIITSSIVAIRNNVKSIKEILSEKKISPALKRMKEVQLNSLAISLNEITLEYYSSLVDHSEKSKKLLYDMISITDEDNDDFEELVQKGKFAFFTNNLLLNELEQKAIFRELEDRRDEILKIERSITELKNLMQDLNLMVALEAEHTELVEKHVQKTSKKVDATVEMIKTASKLKNKARKRKLIISLICVCVVSIAIFITVINFK